MILIGPYSIMPLAGGQVWIRHEQWEKGVTINGPDLALFLGEYLAMLGYHPTHTEAPCHANQAK